MSTPLLCGDGGSALVKPRTGLYVEDTGDELRLVVVFHDWGREGELIVPLSFTDTQKLMLSLQKHLVRRQQELVDSLPPKIQTSVSGKSHA